MVSRWNVVITGIYTAKKHDTDTGTLSRIAPGKRYTLHVNWPGFKGLRFNSTIVCFMLFASGKKFVLSQVFH